MRCLLSSLLFCFVGSTQAALITFAEDAPTEYSDDLGYPYRVTSEQGMVLESEPDYVIVGTSNADISIYACPECRPGFDMYHESGSLFSLNSLDLNVIADIVGPVNDSFVPYEIIGLDSNQNIVASMEVFGGATEAWQTLNFGAEWQGLSRVQFWAGGNCCYLFYLTTEFDVLEISNIDASVVPIPAAVWLFGSALVGLGWVKRKGSRTV